MVTAVASDRPTAATGSGVSSLLVPSPSCPYMLSPQHSRPVPETTAHTDRPLAPSAVTPLRPDTATGVSDWLKSPVPSCPMPLCPQQRTSPFVSNAQELASASANDWAGGRFATVTGRNALFVVPSPSSPSRL